MKCPKCGGLTAAINTHSVTLDKCHGCDGIWLDHGELEQLRNTATQGLEEDLEQQFGNPDVTREELDGYLRCPRCDDIGLRTHYVSYMKPVRVDLCPSCHGMWLDDKELDSLLKDKKQLDNVKVSGGMKALLANLAKKFKTN
jgi:Zn-finger nucleic acid-binding protein